MNKKQNLIKQLFCLGKSRYIKWWIWVIVMITVITVVSIPFLINIAYLEGMNLKEANTAFTASDILGFYGTILGSTATIIAVILTIRFEKHQQIIGAKPLIQTENNLVSFKEDISRLTCIDKYLIYPFNKQEQVGSSINFTSDYIFRNDYPNIVNKKDYLVFSYILSNAGLGGAVNVDLKVNELVSMPKFFIGNNDYKTFIFIINKAKADTTIQITFNYTDVFNIYNYAQKEQLHIYLDKDGNLLYRQELSDLISKQEILQQ